MPPQYDEGQIRAARWPSILTSQDGGKSRTFRIQLSTSSGASPSYDSFIDKNSLSQIALSIKQISINEIEITITSYNGDFAADLSYRCGQIFRMIDSEIGPIDNIEGQLRDFWPPWYSDTIV